MAAASARSVGRYMLHGEIASGGMATVYFGRLLGPVAFSRTVAIKCLHPQFAKDPEFVAMFLDEARLAARIRHPNVVPTIDVVALEGELFLVLEYVEGESLSRLHRAAKDRGVRIPLPIISAILGGVLHGLHAAHEAKDERGMPLSIVHRDVSPHNVLVGVDGVARVLDFGVAKAAGRLHITREGQLKGKLPYMAPEQIRGNVSRATDVYACGVVLWELLAGQRLFKGDEAFVLASVLTDVVDPPSEHARGIPSGLDALTLRALDRDASKRFATAREMARALEKLIPPASASDVGEWVEDIARETITARSRLVASMEGNLVAQPALPQAAQPALLPTPPAEEPEDLQEAPTIALPAGDRGAAVLPNETSSPQKPQQDALAGASQSKEGTISSQMSSISVSASKINRPMDGRRGWIIAAFGGAVLLAFIGVRALVSSSPEPAAASTGSSETGATTTAPSLSAVPPLPTAAAAPAASSTGPTPPASASASAPVPAARTNAPKQPRPPAKANIRYRNPG